jgi:hypothetical protein
MIGRMVTTLALAVALLGCAAAPESATSASPMASASASAAVADQSAGPSRTAIPSASVGAEAPPAWQALDAAGPAAREDHTWTADPSGSIAYLFGGRDGGTVYGDLWAYHLDDDRWEELTPSAGPAARFGHEAVWVDGIGLVVFAGQAGPTFFNDLWALDAESTTWRSLPSSGAVPVSRYGSCAAIGPDGRLWISHGFTSDGTRFADTRAYDFEAGAWADATPAGGLPVSRCLHGCWWTDDGALTLFGGQTTGVTALMDRWRLEDGAWTEVEGDQPTARNLYARVRLDGATLVVGGQAIDGGFHADAWLLRDGDPDAVPLPIAGDAPPARAGAEMVLDALDGRILLFGGRDGDGALADTWELSGIATGTP